MQDMFYSSHFIFRTTKDVSVEGYDVPKDSLILANLWGFMKDPDHWEDPMMFRPERFLKKTEVGLKVEKKERFVPYGMGRRICMGQGHSLHLCHNTVTNPVARQKPDPENYTDGFTMIPHPYHVKLICRN